MRLAWLLALLLGAAAAAQGAVDILDRTIDIRLADADLAGAVRTLKESAGLGARVEGTPPARKVSLEATGVPARNALNALARLYGVRWEQRLTTIIFVADPLQREVDVSVKDATLPEALQALSKTTGVPLRFQGKPPEQKVTLATRATPAARVVEALRVLFDVPWQSAWGETAFAAARPGAAPGDPALAGKITRIRDLLAGNWGEKDTRLKALTQDFIKSFPAETLRGLQPGQTLTWADFTPAQRQMAVEIAQREAVGSLAEFFNGGRLYLKPYAASAGGVYVRRSQDGLYIEMGVGSDRGGGVLNRIPAVPGAPPG